MEAIQNVYCVGRNYRLHAAELGNEVPKNPFLFMKPNHAVVMADGQPVVLPGNVGEVHHELELVLRIGQTYDANLPMERIVTHVALGIDFTLRDIQNELKQKGLPWLRAKGFRNSAVITRFIPFPGLDGLMEQDFKLLKNQETVQQGNIRDMLFDIPTLLAFTAEHYGLTEGDIVFTGTPAGVGSVKHGDTFSMLWGDLTLGTFSASVHA